MRSGLQIFGGLSVILVLGATIAGCGGDDDSDSTADAGYDASTADSGRGGSKATTAGRGGTGGSRAVAGRSGSGAVAGRSAAGASGMSESGAGGRAATQGGTGGTVQAGAGTGAGGTTAGNAGTPAAGAGASSTLLTDAQIAAVTTAANTGEIALGNLAVQRARLADVRAFAQEMVTMHGAAQSRSLALTQTLGITPVASNLSTGLEQDAQRTSASLEAASAADFDLQYVQSQVQIHMQVLTIFDEVLLPSVTSPAVRNDLNLARADVQTHLAEAQALLVVVQSAPPLEEDAGVEDAGL